MWMMWLSLVDDLERSQWLIDRETSGSFYPKTKTLLRFACRDCLCDVNKLEIVIPAPKWF